MDGWFCNVDGDLISYSARGLSSFPGPLIYSQEPEQFIYQISQKMEDPDLEGSIFPFKGVKFPADRDEEAIMKAMMAVISSTTTTPSSSAASSPSTMSNPAGEVFGEQMTNSSRRAFTPYNPVLAPQLELKGMNLRGQKMIKSSICFLRRIKRDREQAEGTKTTTWSAPATSNQLHHVLSERKRREKLNDSFHRLSMILPPDSKRDKASVLISAKNYLKTLRAQIKELEEKNRSLEAQRPKDEMEEGDFQVEVMKLSSDEPRSQLEQIHIKITVRVDCDIVNLILHVLECLKGMRIASISSVDARAYSPQMRIYATANLKIQIKSCDWNEALFQEAMNRAINGVAPPAEFLFAV